MRWSGRWWWGALAAFVVVAAAGPAAATTVLFDQGHGQRFVADRDGELDLSGLAGVFGREGSRCACPPSR